MGTTHLTYTVWGALLTEDGPWADDTVTYSCTTNRLRAGLSLAEPRRPDTKGKVRPKPQRVGAGPAAGFNDGLRTTDHGRKTNPSRCSSKKPHEPSGLYYCGYRFYAPTLQRWANRYPLEERRHKLLRRSETAWYGYAIDLPDITRPAYMESGSALAGTNNVYLYVDNGISQRMDPDGLKRWRSFCARLGASVSVRINGKSTRAFRGNASGTGPSLMNRVYWASTPV